MKSEGDEERRRAALERILSTAALQRRRGDYQAAWRAADDALALEPTSAPVFCLMGDLNADAEDWDAALQCYQRALELSPGLPGAEVGLGRATLALAGDLSGSDVEPLDPVLLERTPEMAAVRSLILPGLGQAYAGDLGRGVVYLVICLLAAGGVVWKLTALPGVVRHMARGGGSPFAVLSAVGVGFWLLLAVLAVLPVVAGLDAYRLLKQRQAGETEP